MDSIVSEDSTLAEDGLQTSIDNASFFNKANPLAVSTVGREKRTRQFQQQEDCGGSFLDMEGTEPFNVPSDEQQQPTLSFSACNQSNTSRKMMDREPVNSKSDQLISIQTDGTAVTESWSGIQQFSKMDSEDGRNSSLGILRVDDMSDFSSSILESNGQGTQQTPDIRGGDMSSNIGSYADSGTWQGERRGDVSSRLGSYTDSGSWQNSSKQDSKNDHPVGKNHVVDTVKKRPSMIVKDPGSVGSHPLLGAVCSALAYGDTEDNENDITVPDVQLLEDELLKLDDDFGDINELEQTCIDDEEEPAELYKDFTGGKNADMFDELYLKPSVKHDGGDGAEGVNPYPSLSKVALFEDVGSTEDISTPRRDTKQHGAAAAARLSQKQNILSDGSEIDTEDELEMARQAIGQSKPLQEVSGVTSIDTEPMSQLSTASIASSSRVNNNDNDTQTLSIAMRQSAEGEVVTPLVPGDGGGGGDGSSGSDSEDVRRATSRDQSDNQAQSFLSAFQQSFRPIQPPPSEVVDVEGHDCNTSDSPLESRYFVNMPPGDATQASQWGPGLDNSTFTSEDLIQGSQQQDTRTDDNVRGFPGEGAQMSHTDTRTNDNFGGFPGDRSEASGFNADDIQNSNDYNTSDSPLESRYFVNMPPGDATQASQWGPGLDNSTFTSDDLIQGSQPLQQDPRTEDNFGGFPGDRSEASGFNANDILAGKSTENPFDMVESSFGSFGLNPPSSPDQSKRFSTKESITTNSQFQELQNSPLSYRTSTENRSCYSPIRRASGSSVDNEIDRGDYQLDIDQVEQKADFTLWEQQELFKTAQGEFTIQEDNFISSDDALNMLQNDEKEFEKENVFRQDDNMDPVETPDTSSWMYKSEMSVSCPPSMAEGMVGENKDLRISIGTYLMGRSGALGSLDGENDLPRPSFGMKVTTPPNNRKPIALIDSPVSRDLDLQTSPSRDLDISTSPARDLDTRTSGVGDEEGDSTVVDDKFSLSGLDKTPTVQTTKASVRDTSQRLSPRDGNPELDEVFSRPDEAPAVKFIKNDQPLQVLCDKTWLSHGSGNTTPDTSYSPGGIIPSNASLAENSGVLNVSELSRVISAASKDSNPAELANLILKLSSKHPSRSNDSKSQRKDSKSVDGGTVNQEITERVRKNSDSMSESGQKSRNASRLPVRKGTNLNRSGRRPSSESDRKGERGGEKMEQSVMTVSQLKKSVGDSMSDNETEIFHKSKPDGEESEIENVKRTNLQKKENISRSSNSMLEDSGNLKHHSYNKAQKHRRPSQDSNVVSKSRNSGELVQDRGLMSGKTVTSKVLTGALDKVHQSNRGTYGARITNDIRHSQEMVLPFSRENQPADGQAAKSDKFINPSTPPAVNQNLSHGGSKQADVVGHLHVRPERSPRSSVNSLGLTGHHIPDGTEYADERGVSRENLVGGTDDIDTADSRGFDLISDRQMMSRNLSGMKSSLPTNQMPSQVEGQSRFMDSGPINTQVTRSDRKYNAELKQQEQNEVSRNASTSPRHTPNLHGQAEVRGTKDLQYLKDTREDRRFASSPKTTIYNQEKIPDELLMPPPPVPSFNHNLLSTKTPKSGAPLLLTKQSLLDTDFAREYLVRDAPGQVFSKDNMLSYPQQGGNQNDLNSLKTPSSRLSQFCIDPMYQSTPFTRAPTQSKPENTITTSSAMHSMMSTGIFEEMIPSQSVMHHHDNTTGVFEELIPSQSIRMNSNKTMMPKKLTPVTAPGELRFGEVCCLGIGIKTMLPLTNPTGDWLECHLKIRTMSIDGQVARNQVFIPFELKNKVVIEPHKTEEIPIIFIPKVPGTYVAQLLIFSTLFLPKSSDIERIPTEVSLQAIAEKPNIQIVTEEKAVDFGVMKWGTCREKTIKFINLGQALVPIRLAISTRQCTWDAYSFDPRYSPDVSVISQSCRLESPALRKIIKTFYLIGNDGTEQSLPREIKVYCCPKQTQGEKTLAQQPPHLMIARMDIEVDTPSSCIPIIDSLELKSVIGVPKLHIDNENIDGILVEAFPGKNGAKTVTVVNAGNVNIEIKVSLEDDFGGIFRVCPDKIHLKVQERGFTVIEFLPNSAKIPTYDTILNLMIEPDGPYYDLSVRGNVVTELRQGNPVLLADKHFLLFGGVALGSNREKRVIMMNKSSFPVKVRLDIPPSDFQMKSRQYPHCLSSEKDVIIKPYEKYPIYVQYTPSETTECYQKLRIKPQNSTFKYNVPLFGYGGTSNVVIEDTHVYNTDGKRYTDIGTITAGKTVTIQLTLRNTGDRTAYIKSLVYTDNSCTKLLVNRCYVKPDEFLLPVDASTAVAVVFKPTEREAAFCNDRKDVVATIAFMYGDEQSRQRFRRALRDPKADLESISIDRTVRSVNFNVPYKDEHLEKQAPTGPTEITAKGFISSFYSTMSSVHVSLVGQPSHPMNIPCRTPQLHRGSQTMPAALQNDQSRKGQHVSGMQTMSLTGVSGHYSSVNSAVQDKHSYFPVKDSNQNKDLVSMVTDMPPMFYSTVYSQQTDHDWTVKPDSIIVYVPSKRDEQLPVTKLQIMNFKSVSLKFDILVPKGVNLEFTPENGTVEPKSSLTVCVSASATQKISNLPWRGAINISCDDVPKVVKVQMRTDILDDNSCNQPSNMSSIPLYSQTSGHSYSQTSGQSSLIGQSLDLSKSAPGFMSTNSIINFPATKVCEMSETTFNLDNPSNNEINWIISSFAPPYVKEGPDSTKVDEVFRANYKVFDFNKRFGHLQPGKSIQLQIQFMPRSVGKFSQHWEIVNKDGTMSKTTRFQLCGEGIQMMKDDIPASLLHLTENVKDSVSEKKNFQVVLADDKIDFPECEVGQTQVCKVRLKNESSAPHTVEVIKPRSPFHTKHLKFEIKPRRYLHFPVHFKPESVGSYEGMVVFRVDVGYHLSLKLEGECKSKAT